MRKERNSPGQDSKPQRTLLVTETKVAVMMDEINYSCEYMYPVGDNKS